MIDKNLIQQTNEEGSDDYHIKIIDLMKFYRHDWLNHFQVILGYVSLKKYEQIPHYIQKVIEDAKKRSIISNFEPSELAVFLYMMMIEYPKLNIELELDEGLEIKEEDVDGKWILHHLKGFLDLFDQRANMDEEYHSLFLSLNNLDKKMIIIFEYEGNISPVMEKIKAMGKQIDSEGGKFEIDLYNEDECIMELHFPFKGIRGVNHVCR
ncbi:Spo0B domain-containing protein [Tepidibacillus sp. HK-1]|uniref:Spo0B domain-containing protein n=1 Tax=Tepidibacillus sp. HK-1 TaxID=1883407 RepID=UPI0008538AEE|nr:Spo0B domain-containing protein [Tepidibacillus sp. HK-1]GBF10007.1 sporulation initiation phosphotransferase B [Tepidibacillus sp. HK-1]